MTTAEPLMPNDGDDRETTTAADAGRGAPPNASDTGVEAEEPDLAQGEPGDTGPRRTDDTPFRTPAPSDQRREPEAQPKRPET